MQLTAFPHHLSVFTNGRIESRVQRRVIKSLFLFTGQKTAAGCTLTQKQNYILSVNVIVIGYDI